MKEETLSIDTSFLTIQQLSFLDFCKDCHGYQVRKYTGEPYWHHLVNVAEILIKYDMPSVLIPVALGHDLKEDTDITDHEIHKKLTELNYSTFDAEYIVGGIKELTDVYVKDFYPNMNRSQRKGNEAKRLGKIDPYFQTVKYCDLIDNMESIVSNDRRFARTYIEEKKAILKVMNKGYFDIYLNAASVLFECQKELLQQ